MTDKNKEDLVSNIEFLETHQGGNLDDSTQNFFNQKKIIKESTNDYIRLLNYNNKLNREKDQNDNFVEQLNVELNTNPYRLNTLPTTIDGVNYSNPIVYPKDYDPYFEYLHDKKLGGLNTRIVLKKNIVNVDSANRNNQSTLNVDNYLKLQPNSLVFTSNTNKFKILINDAIKKYSVGDKITLRGFKTYKSTYSDISFYFEDRKNYVIIDNFKPNFDYTIPYYDILIEIRGVTNGTSTTYNNVPISLINQLHKVQIFKINDDDRIGIVLPITFYTDNNLDNTLVSDCEIIYYNLGNYPLSLLNANLPLSDYYLTPYLPVVGVGIDYIELRLTDNISINQNIQLKGTWVNNNFFTGEDIEIGTVSSINVGYPTPSSFKIFLDKNYNNVASIKVISSEIPNILKNINAESDFKRVFRFNNAENLFVPTVNNKLYWDNLLDIQTYFIEIPTGYYSFPQLAKVIEDLVSTVPRITTVQNNLYLFNDMTVDFDEKNNIASFKSYSTYILPDCLADLNKESEGINEKGNAYVIKINHPNHNLNVGDRIFITGSIDYYDVDKSYINDTDGHLIINIINNDFYEIKLTNINLINDVGNTFGGKQIKIKTSNSFRLRFDYPDTFGSIIGFRYVGTPNAITPYCNLLNSYTVNNLDPYVYDVGKILVATNLVSQYQIFNDFDNTSNKYLLLQCTNLNTCTNPNGPPYFYKFLMNGPPNSIIYNSFVNAPVYLNPPVRFLSELEFTFVDPNGKQVNFYNRNFSLTLEIINIDNSPENTNINTFTARL